MRANNLQGDYCMTCASILDEAQRNFRQVVILDTQCAGQFRSSGDAERFNYPARPEPVAATKIRMVAPVEKPVEKPKKEVKPAKKSNKR